MDDLHGRFRRLDRVETPNLWNEAVARAAELELAPRRAFNPSMGLIAAALLLAALGGTIAVGAWLNRPPSIPEIVTYDNGVIAAHAGCGRIVTLDPTSLETREIVGAECQDDLWAAGPVWSSDGSRLAYLATGEEQGTVGAWIYEAATGEARQLDTCPNASCSSMDFSPDGSLVSYLAGSQDGTELVLTEVDSGESHRIPLPAVPRYPRFSPDGTRIALPLYGGRSGLYLVDVEGVKDGRVGSPTLLSGIIDVDSVAWSPDGEWIAYTQSGGLGAGNRQEFNGYAGHSGLGIVVARTDGSESRILATGPFDTGPVLPTWSPDSASVAFVTTPNEGSAPDRWMLELWTAGIDGGEPTRIYASDWGKDAFGVPDWSPDGEWIAFGVSLPDDPLNTGTFLVRPDGSDVRRVSNEMLDPVWQPIPKEP